MQYLAKAKGDAGQSVGETGTLKLGQRFPAAANARVSLLRRTPGHFHGCRDQGAFALGMLPMWKLLRPGSMAGTW